MRVGSRHPTHRKPHSPACACDQASELSADHVLKHLAIKRQVGNNLLQLRVLIFKLLQPPHLRRLHAIVAPVYWEQIKQIIPAPILHFRTRGMTAPPASPAVLTISWA